MCKRAREIDMDDKQPLQDQLGTPKSPNEAGAADGKVHISIRFIERLHPIVLAAILTSVLALASAIVTTYITAYLPARTRLDELRLAATMTAESSRALIIQGAPTIQITLGTQQAPSAAIPSGTASQPSMVPSLSPQPTLVPTNTPSPPTATNTPSPTATSTATPTATRTATPVPRKPPKKLVK